MNRERVALSLIVAFCGPWLGCKKSEPGAGSTSVSTGTGIGTGTGTGGMHKTRDAAVTRPNPGADDADAGGSAFALGECSNVSPTTVVVNDQKPSDYNDAISMPSDLMVTRVVATWSGACKRPTLRIEMSAGSCESGDQGHALVFNFDALAIKDGVADAGALAEGLNTIVPDSETSTPPISIRYVRPATLHPHGTWGTCPGASGTLSVAGQPELKAQAVLQARFELVLASCGRADAGIDPQNVDGSFNVRLRRGLTDYCP